MSLVYLLVILLIIITFISFLEVPKLISENVETITEMQNANNELNKMEVIINESVEVNNDNRQRFVLF